MPGGPVEVLGERHDLIIGGQNLPADRPDISGRQRGDRVQGRVVQRSGRVGGQRPLRPIPVLDRHPSRRDPGYDALFRPVEVADRPRIVRRERHDRGQLDAGVGIGRDRGRCQNPPAVVPVLGGAHAVAGEAKGRDRKTHRGGEGEHPAVGAGIER